jgi:hypothetical protein
VEVDEVNYLSPADPVNQVSNGTPKNQAKGNGGIEALCSKPAQEIKDKGYGGKGGKDQQNGLGGAYLTGKDAEGDALVSGVKDGEKRLHDRQRVMEGEMLRDKVLGVLVKHDHRERYDAGDEIFVSRL